MNSTNTLITSPDKNVKIVQLKKWIDRASPPKNNLRYRKNLTTTSKKSVTDSSQKKISSFFNVLPKSKINNEKSEKSPTKKENKTEVDANELYLSPSAKLDSQVPKVQDILQARENEQKLKQIHALIEESSKQFLQALDNSDSDKLAVCFTQSVGNIKFKHCKHLTVTQINKRFKKDVKFIDDIFYGRVYNERNEQFRKDSPLNNDIKNDLRICETNIAFTQDQLIYIISLFRDRYDNGNIYKNSDFYFKVLLPEYCLKLYSDEYKMKPQIALAYLKSIPIQDLCAVD